MYVSVKWRDEANNTGLQTKRVGRGEKVRFTYNMPTATDQEILVYAGHYLKRLGNVSNLEPTAMLISNADRLTEIECHSPNLINTDLSFCTKLQRIDLSNCIALGTGIGAQPTLNIQNCKYLRYCDCRNTKLTAIYTMQAGGSLEEIYFPESTQIVQVTNQTYLKILGLPYGNLYCKNLANVEISNCHRIEYMHYPYNADDNLTFEPLRYVQNLVLNNSLDKIDTIQFSGFDKLISLELNSMHYIKQLGFNNMMNVINNPSLAYVKLSDCPLIDTVTFNVTDVDHKIHFVNDAVIDLSGLQSVSSIEANTPLIGLKTLIVPNSMKNIIFNYKYGKEEDSSLQNIWSSLVNHTNDGFKGIDLLGVELKHITMNAFKNINKAINIHLSPIDIAPEFNSNRDNKMYQYIQPEGYINLTKYTGPMNNMFKGMDLSKLDIVIGGNRPQQDLTGLFEDAIVSSNDKLSGKDKANGILNCYPFADVWDDVFRRAILDFDTNDIIFPTNRLMSTANMFRGSNISEDLDMPANFIAVDNMFRDCKSLKTYLENWTKEDFYDPEMTTSGCYFNSGGDLEFVPPEWGGYGFYPEVTSEIVINIPYENYELTLCNSINKLSIGVVNWGDGEITFLEEDNYKHVYKEIGTYTVKGHFTFGSGFAPNSSLYQCLTRVVYLAGNTSNLNQAFKYCRYLKSVNLSMLNITDLSDTFYDCSSLDDINFSGSTFNGLTSMKNTFNGCTKLLSLNLTIIDTKSVEDMSYLFNKCSSLSELNISNWDTSNVTNMRNMFCDCESLTSLSVSHFVTAKVESMGEMFKDCVNLSEINVSAFVTDNVKDFSGMFDGCSLLSSIDISNFNTANATSMANMFNACIKLETLDVSSFVTTEVKTMERMFQRCAVLQHLDLSNFDTSNVTSITYMFTGCSALHTIVLGEKDFKQIKDVKYLFSGCSKLANIDFSQTYFENVENFTAMFINCNSLLELDLSNFSTSKATTMKNMFSGCSSLTTLNLSSFDTSSCEAMDGMFNYCTNLTSLTVPFITTSVKTMKDMFKNCRRLVSLDLLTFDTKTVTDMENMFSECISLKTLDISHFNDVSLSNAKSMFKKCNALTDLNLGSLTFERVTSLDDMFNDCSNMTVLDLSHFNTRQVTSMARLFCDCGKLTNIIFGPNFVTNAVTSMTSMFGNTISLSEIDLSNFDTSAVQSMDYMFENAICNVDLSGKNTNNVTTVSRMFKDYKGSSINMDGCSLMNSTDNINFITNANSLIEFIPPINIYNDISVIANQLPADAFVAVINNLLEVPQPRTLTIGSINLAKLTEDQIAKAVIKNWSIA
jgi:surface protein